MECLLLAVIYVCFLLFLFYINKNCYLEQQGGFGGGVVNITGNTVQIIGILSCNGNPGNGNGASGGSGGSIYISANSIQGPGVVSSTGGTATEQGYNLGGGGSGGRIAIYYTTYSFTGDIFAFGGGGSFPGGPGTILKASSNNIKILSVDNQNQAPSLYVQNFYFANTSASIGLDAWIIGESITLSEILLQNSGGLGLYSPNAVSINF